MAAITATIPRTISHRFTHFSVSLLGHDPLG
jgi:hypothetical protein